MPNYHVPPDAPAGRPENLTRNPAKMLHRTAPAAETALALLWLARAPVTANYLGDVMAPVILLGGSLSVAFVVLTQQAVADVHPDDKGVASGIFETVNHLFGGALGVALYATILTATASNAPGRDGYRAAFLAATALAAFGLLTARQAGRRRSAGTSPDRPEHQEPETAT